MFDLDQWREIADALGRNKLRTALTAFGVFWGTLMLSIMLGSGTGLKNGVEQQYAGSATNSFFLWTWRTSKPFKGLPAGRAIQFTNEDTLAVRRGVPDAAVVAPRNQLGGFRGGNNVSRGVRSGAFSVMGDVPAIREVTSINIARGRFLNQLDLDDLRKVAVIGPRVQELLFAAGEEPLGESIRINGVYFKVVGVFGGPFPGDDQEQDQQTIFIPFSTFQRAFNYGNRLGWFAITAAPGVRASLVEEKTIAILKGRHQVAPDDERAIGHWNTEEEYEKVAGLFKGIRALIWIVGIGTLAAGVVGVSNIMLVIVKERTREIGIRRAVGATPADVSRQIVLEAIVLTGLAGYLGLVVGVGGIDLARTLLASSGGSEMFLNPDVSPGTVLRALAVIVAAGALGGLIPALRASRMRPVDALRAE